MITLGQLISSLSKGADVHPAIVADDSLQAAKQLAEADGMERWNGTV